jgi:hypothetical protein
MTSSSAGSRAMPISSLNWRSIQPRIARCLPFTWLGQNDARILYFRKTRQTVLMNETRQGCRIPISTGWSTLDPTKGSPINYIFANHLWNA